MPDLGWGGRHEGFHSEIKIVTNGRIKQFKKKLQELNAKSRIRKNFKLNFMKFLFI